MTGHERTGKNLIAPLSFNKRSELSSMFHSIEKQLQPRGLGMELDSEYPETLNGRNPQDPYRYFPNRKRHGQRRRARTNLLKPV